MGITRILRTFTINVMVALKIQPLNFLPPLHELAGRLFCIKTADFLLSMGPETTDKSSKWSSLFGISARRNSSWGLCACFWYNALFFLIRKHSGNNSSKCLKVFEGCNYYLMIHFRDVRIVERGKKGTKFFTLCSAM